MQLQGLFCCSAPPAHRLLCLTGPQSHRKKARRSSATFATLSVCNPAGVSMHRGHSVLLVPGTALSSRQLGVWEGNPHLGRGFPRLLGHCSPTWRDEQVTHSAKGSDRWQQRDKFHPEQPVRGRRSSRALAVCHLLKIF